MEQMTKRILAIVLIAVIGTGIGVGAWFLLIAPGAGTYNWTAADCPGAPPDINASQIIRFGALGDLKNIQGQGNYNGAELAATEINQDGGIMVNGSRYYIGLQKEDTDEANPNLDATKGVAAARRIIYYKQAQFIIGGFRTEAALEYDEVAMDEGIPYINTGCATDIFTQKVGWDYDRYKYFFRIMPINSTSLVGELVKFMFWTLLQFKMGGLNVSKIAFIREDLSWTEDMVDAFAYYLTNLGGTGPGNPFVNCTIVANHAFDIHTVDESVMTGFWNDINTKGAHITIPLISASGGLPMMISYGSIHPQSLVLGINVMSQVDTFWDQTGGGDDAGCEYEITMVPVINVSKTPRTIPFWEAYLNNYTIKPVYTATGAYDAVYAFKRAIEDSQSFRGDDIVIALEGFTPANPMVGVMGNISFTGHHKGATLVESWGHDLREGYPFGTTLMVQWINGTYESLPAAWGIDPAIDLYPPTLATSTLELPHWLLPTWGT